MANTVNGAFATFMAEHVNLNPTETQQARASRDWLVEQIADFHGEANDFPRPYPEMHNFFGSFHRRTKIRPLDDIDLISCLHAEGCTYLQYGSEVRISVPTAAYRLLELCHDGTNLLNSRRVINRFVGALSGVPQYRRAEVGRDGEAAVVALTSYPWSFDVVPAFHTNPEYDGRTYYLIPDGQGHWKKTDPRIDQNRITSLIQIRGKQVLPALRLIKYWNGRPTMPTAPSYLFESLVLSHYEAGHNATDFVDLAVAPILSTVATSILYDVADPKRIQGNINPLNREERVAISNRATRDAAIAGHARRFETLGNHRESIRLWSMIFGPQFPVYTGT